jgi:hypothetical protein
MGGWRRGMRWSWCAIGGALLVMAPVSMGVATAAVSPTLPRIVDRPKSVMVNSSTTLTGTGFPPSTTIALQECGKTGWIAPQSPCASSNGISVTTNAVGGFKTAFKVSLCPDGVRGREPTSEICYIGEPKPSGIDTITLLGAVKITVTYP